MHVCIHFDAFDYSQFQAIIEMVRDLRKGQGKTGLVLANGGSVTTQHVIILSSSPRSIGPSYPERNPLPDNLESEPHPPVDIGAHGEAEIETYTVEFERDGSPANAYIVARLLSNGHRVIANEADDFTLKELASSKEEQIGKRGWLSSDPDTEGRGLFTFQRPHSLL
jgi:Thiolase-like protein type 1 additional C-terminal domain